MNPSTFREFFYYDPALPNAPHDFTDPTVLSKKERLEFLTKYAEFLEKSYGLPENPVPVVTEEASEKAAPELCPALPAPRVSRRIFFDRMDAALENAPQPFDGWNLYTKKVSVEDGCLCFADLPLPPTPAAAYAFDGRLQSFTFSFFIDKKFFYPLPAGILDTTYGHTVELRCGIQDLVKLQFYPNGSLRARAAEPCPYHLRNFLVGEYAFGQWQTVTVLLGDGEFRVVLNGKESRPLPMPAGFSPDLLFLSSGMFHTGEWRLRPEKMVLESGAVTDFFRPAAPYQPDRRELGEVALPYAVGNYENRNRRLILTKEFEAEDFANARLTVSSLDPGGSVWLNGICITETDSFETLELDVTAALRPGKNRLRLLVEPRAPEVFFNWHRQKDSYVGWFSEGAALTLFRSVEIRNLEAVATAVTETGAAFRVTADMKGASRARVLLRQIHPVSGEELAAGEFPVEDGRLQAELTAPVTPWSTENPALYALRVEALDENGAALDDEVIETGFRTIRQEEGRFLLNGRPIVLTGALLMQFLPPYDKTSTAHICPSTAQVARQLMMLKAMNGNTLRLHILGYGTNDARYARIADRLGIMVIWITRYIDSAEHIPPCGVWHAREGYLRQMRQRINHPSIIMWEGSNEYHPALPEVDAIYDAFVPAVKSVDESRLICPVSHLYYAGELYSMKGCGYYNDAGTMDQDGRPASSSEGWRDPLVVRSAHTYTLLLGYGEKWSSLRTQPWNLQPELCESKDHGYIVSEFAVIGRQNPHVPEAGEYFNPYSYEFPDEVSLGFSTTPDQWRQSQAYQALAAACTVRRMRQLGVDGMLWCCLMGGANDGGYLKPPIDFYGYPKLAFYTLRDGYAPLTAASDDVNVVKGGGFSFTPVLYGTAPGARYALTVTFRDETGAVCARQQMEAVGGAEKVCFPAMAPELPAAGCYSAEMVVEER